MARRCGKVFQSKQEDKSQRSYDISLLQQAGSAAATLKEEPADNEAEVDNKEDEDDDEAINDATNPSSATGGTYSMYLVGGGYIVCCGVEFVVEQSVVEYSE